MDTEREEYPSHWIEMPYQQSPPLPDYQPFNYGSSPVLPLDSFGMSIPPPYSSLPLTMPSHTWPSMLTQHQQQPPHPPPHYQETSLPPMHIPPSISPAGPLPPPRKSSTGGSNPRRTLTDEDRRRMCLYHEENKTAKQTDIGALFGVERSTVSKVLRQKEKYLNPDDGTRSPIKRAKGRVPDIEKALSNWVRNYTRQGYPLNDEMIREKALFFASTCGCPEGKEKVLTRAWLEKFKQKYLSGTKSRKSSFDTVASDDHSPIRLSIDSALASAIQSPTSVLSPISPTATGFATPSPLSPTQSQENMKKELTDSLAELAGTYQQQHSHTKSTTSLDTTSSLSASVTSPTSLVSDSPFTPTSQRISPTDNNQTRRGSQLSLNTIDLNMAPPEQPKDQMSSQAALQQALSVAIPESPLEEEHDKTIGLEGPSIIKRKCSNPEIKAKTIYPPSFSKSTTVSPISSPGSPSQAEARQALELVMNYFEHQPAGLGAQEFMTIGKLMERLELAKSQPTLPGGLTRIDEHEDAPHLVKKTSIHSLG